MHDATRWSLALLTLVGFGLSMGVNPALYGAAADMLARNDRVMARMSWMVGGLAAGATALFFVFQSFDPTRLVDSVEGRVEAALLSRTVDLIAGGVFLLAVIPVVWWRLRVPTLSSRPARTPKAGAHSASYFTLGLSCALVGFTTLPIMYMTGRVASALSPDLLPRILAYAVFLVALGGPFFAIAWIWGRFPSLSRRITGFYARVMHWDYRWAFAALLAVAGLVFIALGLWG